MAIVLNDSISVSANKPVEDKYLLNGTVYTSTASAISTILEANRYIGLTVNINNIEYWWAAGTADAQLVVKTPGISGVLQVANGGTGATTLTGILKGNGTSAFTAAIAGTDYQVPLVSGTNIKTINGNSVLGSGNLTVTGLGAWDLGSGGTLTGANTINSTLVNSLTFSSTGTATANNQSAINFNGTHTMRATASDAFGYMNISPTITVSNTNQNVCALNINATLSMTGGIVTATGGTSTLSGLTAGTYTNVSIASTTGVGTGALFTIIATTSTISISAITTAGSNYKVGDVISFNGSQFGGSGTRAYIIYQVDAVNLTANSNIINITSTNTPSNYGYIGFLDTKNNTQVRLTSDNTLTLWNNANQIWNINGNAFNITALSGLNVNTNATFSNIITSNFIRSTQDIRYNNITNGFPFQSSGNLFVASVNMPANSVMPTFGVAHTNVNVGLINTVGSLVGGTGYTPADNIPLTGGHGSGASIKINTVSSGIVTSVSIRSVGTNYQVGDVLIISGGGGDATVTVTSVDLNNTAISFADITNYTDALSNNKYFTVGYTGNINITSTQSGSIGGFYYNPTITNIGSFSHNPILVVPTGTANGIGTASPTATLQINGSSGVNTLKTVGYGTGSNLSWAAYQSDGTTLIRGLTDAGNLYGKSGSTSMTDGFVYIPSAAGAPTGTVTTITGNIPLYYNSSNNSLYAYNSGWQNLTSSNIIGMSNNPTSSPSNYGFTLNSPNGDIALRVSAYNPSSPLSSSCEFNFYAGNSPISTIVTFKNSSLSISKTTFFGLTYDATSQNIFPAGSYSTAMTSGFLSIPSAAGAPTGTPLSQSYQPNAVPLYYDSSNNQLYIYNGAWKKVALT